MKKNLVWGVQMPGKEGALIIKESKQAAKAEADNSKGVLTRVLHLR